MTDRADAGRAFGLPPVARTRSGAMRRVGVEIEFAGLMGSRIVDVVVDCLGGETIRDSAAEYRIARTRIGDLRVELDSQLLQRLAEDQSGDAAEYPDWLAEVSDWTTDLIGRLASRIVPWEVVTGPLAMDALAPLDDLVDALRRAGALGTRHAPHYAFGLHLNPELPDLDAATVRAWFKAFLCLKDWLRLRCRPDLLRTMSPYISDFDPDYVRRVVAPAYRPSLPSFMDDYLEANPTRNRSMDLLPLFAEIDEARLRRQIDDPLVKARPTLHYRLPNCEIDDPDWSIGQIWEDWLEVERLAADDARLDEMGEAYAAWLHGFRLPFDDTWGRETPRWLERD